MAEKGFGVKEINLIGASGTPTIESPNNLNLNAVNVAISTNVSIGGTLSVTGNVSVGGTLTYEDVTNIDSVGVITARDHVVVGGGLSVVGISTLSDIVKIMSGLELQTNGTLDLLTSTSSSGIDIQSSSSVQIGQKGFPNQNYATFSSSGVDLYYSGSTKLATTNTGVTVTGTLAATAVTGDGSGLSNLPAATPTTSDIQVVYEITNQTSFSYFRFAGNGVDSSANNPDLFLERGKKYRFINNSGGSHPFQIQTTGGSAYSTGVTNNNASSGNIDFAIRWDAPSQLKYQCTNHGSMQGNIYMTGGVGRWTQQSIVTLQSGSSHEFTGIPSEANEILIVFDGLSFASASNEPEFLLGNSGGYATSGYIISASYEPGGSYTKRTTSIRFLGLGAANYVPTGRLHLWRPVHNNNWWAEGIAYPWATEGEYQHRVVGTANSNGALTKIKVQGSGGANFDNTGNGKIQLSYLRY
tara:strand:+ start:289 stop:1695 length:1407 start_codon:yes stop_codon:yes gene_type:complete